MYIMNPRISKEEQEKLVDRINKTYARHIFVYDPELERKDDDGDKRQDNQITE